MEGGGRESDPLVLIKNEGERWITLKIWALSLSVRASLKYTVHESGGTK